MATTNPWDWNQYPDYFPTKKSVPSTLPQQNYTPPTQTATPPPPMLTPGNQGVPQQTHTGMPQLPQAPMNQQQGQFDWGKLSSLLGVAASAFGRSNYNPRTGEYTTVGARLGEGMNDWRKQESEIQNRGMLGQYYQIQNQMEMEKLNRQKQQDQFLQQLSQNPEFQSKLTEKGIPKEAIFPLMQHAQTAKEMLQILTDPGSAKVPTGYFKAIFGQDIPPEIESKMTVDEALKIGQLLTKQQHPSHPVTIMRDGKRMMIDANTGKDIGEAPSPTKDKQVIIGEGGEVSVVDKEQGTATKVEGIKGQKKSTPEEITEGKIRERVQSKPPEKVMEGIAAAKEIAAQNIEAGNYEASKYGYGIVEMPTQDPELEGIYGFRTPKKDEKGNIIYKKDYQLVPRPDGMPKGARPAPDGNWYIKRGNTWYKVEE